MKRLLGLMLITIGVFFSSLVFADTIEKGPSVVVDTVSILTLLGETTNQQESVILLNTVDSKGYASFESPLLNSDYVIIDKSKLGLFEYNISPYVSSRQAIMPEFNEEFKCEEQIKKLVYNGIVQLDNEDGNRTYYVIDTDKIHDYNRLIYKDGKSPEDLEAERLKELQEQIEKEQKTKQEEEELRAQEELRLKKQYEADLAKLSLQPVYVVINSLGLQRNCDAKYLAIMAGIENYQATYEQNMTIKNYVLENYKYLKENGISNMNLNPSGYQVDIELEVAQLQDTYTEEELNKLINTAVKQTTDLENIEELLLSIIQKEEVKESTDSNISNSVSQLANSMGFNWDQDFNDISISAGVYNYTSTNEQNEQIKNFLLTNYSHLIDESYLNFAYSNNTPSSILDTNLVVGVSRNQMKDISQQPVSTIAEQLGLNRKQHKQELANAAGISNYVGTYTQNMKIKNLLLDQYSCIENSGFVCIDVSISEY